ncbi:MAG: hypothetical protein SFW67_00305 [Myxococcaceae bacterium]|nr:hypothetical protein [Myxococcaceae bacterium]
MTRVLLPLVVSALLAGVFVSACGPTRPACTSTTCLGCCDSTGECRSGFDNSACGTRGNLCAACGLGQSCVSGACSQPNPGGTGGGGSSGGAAGGGFSGGAGGGSAGGAADGGFAGGSGRCDASNCGGCCDAQGQCQSGVASSACGSNGGACLACAANLVCRTFGSGGRCEAAGAGGGAAGGGAAGGGAAGGGSSSCNPQNCLSGCCTSTGQCQTPPTTARCGTGGAACMACAARQTCVSGVCRSCSGCVDIATGRCEPGTQTALCGRAGDFCTNCGVSGAFCSNQQCSSSPPTCTPSSCPDGCCDPQTGGCVDRVFQTNQQCGQGTAAALCRACGPQQVCDTNASAGVCAATSSPDAGGFPNLDGGFPFPGLDGGTQFCLFGSQCAVGECCFTVSGFGVCARIGNPNLLGGITCGRSQQTCASTTCQPGQTCNAQVGVCQ